MREDGFTLAEVIVAAGLGLLVASLAFSLYLFVMRGAENGRGRLAVQNTVHLTLKTISDDVLAADSVFISERGLVVVTNLGDTIRYAHAEEKLLRDGRAMHRMSARVISFQPALKERGYDRLVTVAISIEDGKHVLTGRTSALSRRPKAWAVLGN